MRPESLSPWSRPFEKLKKKCKSPSIVLDCKQRFTIEQIQYTLFQFYCRILAVQHAQKAFYFCQNLIMIYGVTAQWRTWEGILFTAALFMSLIVTVFVRISREFRIKQYVYELKQLTQWMQRVSVDSASDLPGVGSITSNLFNYNYNYNYSSKLFNYITITITLC